ncbi:putative sensor domain DACNV-containing protein [Gloeobacter kilaueensis]|uniref:DAC domain-containing protein n=1 Tax=Gloeobacter kilaueensis (strain ATCC BAA-2537 / CCAP 1431/1 / ULC 316 / JS1) TaxID=1183438 RepID=U5QJT5_GLOK1|nr:diadenylate cyclase [Gloeobacter kilaueensis]AGY57915.1 hypothetical protein GKIL_1669 [Gloeobacter kilaueensis JS1]
MGYIYPSDLAAFVFEIWQRTPGEIEGHWLNQPAYQLPSLATLEELLSTCFQASLLVEEQRPVTFRLLFGEPEVFEPQAGPPMGLLRLLFDVPQPFSAHDLRRLSPAVRFERSLIGVRLNDEGELEIWGIIHSGPRWLRLLRGGRGTSPPLPPFLVICASGRGRLEVCKGTTALAQLSEGQLYSQSLNVFESHWLPASFATVRAELAELHAQSRRQEGTDWAALDPYFVKRLAQNIVKRVIATIRGAHHGGTVVFVDPQRTELLTEKNPYITFKYRFRAEEARARFRTLLVKSMNTLAAIESGSQRPVGWKDYECSNDEMLLTLDEAIFELAHLVATLASVDGAVVMTKRFEILGFGGFIGCENAEVPVVARALDLEGEQVCFESTASVGTRHRSAYRLCQQWHDAVAVVVSQDDGVRFLHWKDGFVTSWNQQTLLNAMDF